jgi:hypothetical protein
LPEALVEPSRFDATQRLVRRVLNGEVVFFVGSGFSIDSEGNKASRLVGRLLAGLLGMGAVLARSPHGEPGKASALLDGLGRVFGIECAQAPGDAARQPARCMTQRNLDQLAREYYNFNDWSVSALGALSKKLLDLDERVQQDLAARMQQLGTFLLGIVGDDVPFDAFDLAALGAFEQPNARGKALFLDLMGFGNPTIMAGEPRVSELEKVAESYLGRLRPRHHALARLAREGLAPALVTTNYDLLLEGAYRLAGFVERRRDEPAHGDTADAPRFSRIAGADDFFARGTGYRSALLLKIHGCAEAYREARAASLAAAGAAAAAATRGARPSMAAWEGYLPALVFTYREIQTWRADAWSRDLIRTLLRTHTIALCGYSGADPIMHATFREVYEEKALESARVALPAVNRVTPRADRPAAASVPASEQAKNATTFFFGRAGRREFHALEILRAATVAAGFSPGELTEHPNQIESDDPGGLPTVDDQFQWLLHCVTRELQRRTLRSRLRRLASRLLQRQPRDKELELILGLFDALCEGERARVDAATVADSNVPAAARRGDFEAVVARTWFFVPGLLRELMLADSIDAHQGLAGGLRRQRSGFYYYPIAEHPEWAAWAVVVELALNRLIESFAGVSASVEESAHAAVSFPAGPGGVHPAALCIRLAGFERRGRRPPLKGAFRHVTYWELGEKEVPWPVVSRGRIPSAEMLWDWALGRRLPTDEEAAHHLGLSR